MRGRRWRRRCGVCRSCRGFRGWVELAGEYPGYCAGGQGVGPGGAGRQFWAASAESGCVVDGVFNVIVRPLLLAVVVGTVPDWRHEPEINATFDSR